MENKNVKNEQGKIEYVVDTSLLVHDPNAIYKFEEHNITILSTVFEELDDMKKGHDPKAFIAREIHRKLDELAEKLIPEPVKPGKGSGKKPNTPNQITEMVSALFHGGVPIGEGLGNIEIKTMDLKLHPRLKSYYSAEIPDHQILSSVLKLKDEAKGKHRIILISKDTNLRLKAKSLGIEVQDYKNDQVPNIDKLDKGWLMIKNPKLDDLVAELYQKGKAKIKNEKWDTIITKAMLKPNMYFTFILGEDDTEDQSVLARVDEKMEYVYRIDKFAVSKIMPRNAEQVFAIDALLNEALALVILNGKAGTGKTLLSMAAGLHLLEKGVYDTILISAAMVTLSNKDMGALPGGAEEKVFPYMQGLYDNLAFIKSQFKEKRPAREEPNQRRSRNNSSNVAKGKPKEKEKEREDDFISISQKDGKLIIQPLPFIRGRSLNNTFFIVDESQNLTPHEMTTILTRAGENTKIIICGDIRQIDDRYLDARSNGLSHATHKMSGQSIVAHVALEKGERSELAELAANLMGQ